MTVVNLYTYGYFTHNYIIEVKTLENVKFKLIFQYRGKKKNSKLYWERNYFVE